MIQVMSDPRFCLSSFPIMRPCSVLSLLMVVDQPVSEHEYVTSILCPSALLQSDQPQAYHIFWTCIDPDIQTKRNALGSRLQRGGNSSHDRIIVVAGFFLLIGTRVCFA